MDPEIEFVSKLIGKRPLAKLVNKPLHVERYLLGLINPGHLLARAGEAKIEQKSPNASPAWENSNAKMS